MMDANRELHKVHTGYGKTLFAVDFIADKLPGNSTELTQSMLDYDINL